MTNKSQKTILVEDSIQLVPIDYQALYSILARRMTAMHTAKVYIDKEDTFAFRIAIEGDLAPSIQLIKVVEKMQTTVQCRSSRAQLMEDN